MRKVVSACIVVWLVMALNAPLVPSAFGAAPDWVLVDENLESNFFYDRSATVKPKEAKKAKEARDEMVRVKTRVIYTEEGRVEAGKMLPSIKDLSKLYESRYTYDLDCAKNESRLLNSTHLDREGVTLKSTDLSPYTEWESVSPQVRMALILRAVCTKQ